MAEEVSVSKLELDTSLKWWTHELTKAEKFAKTNEWVTGTCGRRRTPFVERSFDGAGGTQGFLRGSLTEQKYPAEISVLA
jgi:hypothetical protein